MTSLRLSNRSINGKFENLCYVNSTLNLLHSNKDFASFFQDKKYLELDLDPVDFPISSELSKLFNPHDGGVKSASELRRLIAVQSDQPQFATWDQQDVTEFLQTFLDVLVAEFRRNKCRPGCSLIGNFSGREKLDFQFAVECLTCRYKPVDKIEEFNILSLDIFFSKSGLNLSEIVHQHYGKSDDRDMKCLCPDTDNKKVNVVTSMVQGPEYLFIELRRYRIVTGNQSKSKQVVNLDEVLNLPNGDQYNLISVALHQGDTIQSGHYVAAVRTGNYWHLANDSVVTPVDVKYLSSPDNILVFYAKSRISLVDKPENSSKTPMVDKPENSSKTPMVDKPENSSKTPMVDKPENSSKTPMVDKPESVSEKISCLKCGKKLKHIYLHIKGNSTCGEKYDVESERKKYNAYMSEANKKSREKAKKENPEDYAKKNKSYQTENRVKRKTANPKDYAEKNNKNVRKCKENKLRTMEGRIAAFRRSVRYGAIFPCVCCHRVMFEQQVSKYSGKVKIAIESVEGLFESAIGQLDRVRKVFGDYYLCSTCKSYLCKKKTMPPMSHLNNLEVKHVGQKIGDYTLTKEDIENSRLTDLEQSLIARSLIFMKIHQLPKSRMGCMKDRLIYVPINENDVLNNLDTVIRTPSEAGILPVKVKRKLEYKQSYQEEYVSIPKIVASLRLLHKLKHPDYTFLTEEKINEYEKKCFEEEKE